MPVVLIDAENVRRSQWPNVPQVRLVELARRWADATSNEVVIVFDGPAPVDAGDVVGTGDRTGDDWLVRRALELCDAGVPYWLVTSDRALRASAGESAERTVGGGTFLRELLALAGG